MFNQQMQSNRVNQTRCILFGEGLLKKPYYDGQVLALIESRKKDGVFVLRHFWTKWIESKTSVRRDVIRKE